jgi:hypothetical protein
VKPPPGEQAGGGGQDLRAARPAPCLPNCHALDSTVSVR